MKRILLVNACLIGDNNGTGNTLASIFKNMPKSSVYQLCIDFLREPLSNKQCLFVDKNFSFSRYLLANRRKNKQQSEDAAKHRANISGARASGFKAVLHEFFRGLADILPVRISKNMCNYIEEVKPDYIYTCGSSITSLKTSKKISKKYNIPLVLHVMDNWEETLYSSSVLTKPFSFLLKNELKKVNKCSVQNLAVSQALCNKFSEKYKVNYLPLMNTVDEIAVNPVCYSRDKLTFMYGGSLSINRYESLAQIADVLHGVLGNDGYVFKLFVPSTQNTESMRSYFEGYNVVFSDYVPRQQLLVEYNEADVLVITESFDKNFCDFTKFSLSTKVPEYMACGKPVLAYLSKMLYSYEYLNSSNAALVADNRVFLAEAINEIQNYDKRYNLALNGLRFVKKNHSREYCSKVLSEIFK